VTPATIVFGQLDPPSRQPAAERGKAYGNRPREPLVLREMSVVQTSLRIAAGTALLVMAEKAKSRPASMAEEHEDLPVRYLVYAVLIIVVLAAVAVTTFFNVVRLVAKARGFAR
jgi:hypothetical protein